MKLKRVILLFFAFVFIIPGCVKRPLEIRKPHPVIIWPKPPEVPRIHFVDSFSRPEDLNIREGLINKIFNIFSETDERTIIKPYGIETDHEGRYFVVDTFKKCVHVFDTRNTNYYKFPQKDTSFESPIDIAIGKHGDIFVTDSKEGVVKVFRELGKRYGGEIGRGILERPTGIAINNKTDELVVVDTHSSQIVRYDVNTLSFKGMIGMNGDKEGMFHYPTNIFVSADGHIYISDSLNFRIQIFSPDWKFLHSFGKVGNNPGFFSRPRGVAVDSDGNIYVVDALFDNVQIFSREGKLLMDFGGPGYRYGEFWLPSGIFIDNRDKIFISDTYNKRIQVFQYIKEGEL
ncbi:MAG: 6-bladed beta-propeller [Thermodesulfovibrionia bacterium]|nr:6-bladed beta-propeller [Thermodesulfovibrionia bacterium]